MTCRRPIADLLKIRTDFLAEFSPGLTQDGGSPASLAIPIANRQAHRSLSPMPTNVPSRTLSLPVICIALTLGGFSLCCHAASPTAKPNRKLVGEQEDGGVLVTTNQIVTPAGKVQRIDAARPKDMALSPDGQTLAVLTIYKVLFYKPDGTLKGSVSVKPGPLGLVWQPDGQALYASGEDGAVYQITREGGDWKATTFRAIDATKVKKFSPSDLSPPSEAKQVAGPRRKNDPQVAGLAVSPDGQRLYAALGINNEVAVVDLTTKQNVASIPTGIAPYRIALSPDGKTLYCANRGGRAPARGAPRSALSGLPPGPSCLSRRPRVCAGRPASSPAPSSSPLRSCRTRPRRP